MPQEANPGNLDVHTVQDILVLYEFGKYEDANESANKKISKSTAMSLPL